jgi:hypothetical protein
MNCGTMLIKRMNNMSRQKALLLFLYSYILIFSILHISGHKLSLDNTSRYSCGELTIIDFFADSNSNCIMMQFVNSFYNIQQETVSSSISFTKEIVFICYSSVIIPSQIHNANGNKSPPIFS